MPTNAQSASLAMLSAFVAFSSCAPDPKVVAEKASTDVKSLIREAWETGQQTNNWRSVDDAFVQSGASSASSRPKLPEVSNLDTGMDTIGKRVANVFTESNIEDKSGGALTFRVRGIDLCTNDNNAIDNSCANQIDKMNLRVKASGDLDLAILIGAEKIEMVQFHIRSKKSIAIETDLAQVQKGVQFINDTFNSSGASNPFASVTASGKIEFKLEKNGPQDFTVSYSVLSPVSWSSTGQDGVARIGSLESRSPALALQVDASNRKASFKVDMGKSEYRGVWKDFGNQLASGPLVAILSGLTGTFIVEDGKPIVLENFGIGPSTSSLTYSGKEVFSADFNKDLGRNTTITANTTGTGWSLSSSKSLTADVFVSMESIEHDQMYPVQEEFRNAKYTASFTATSGSPTVQIIAAKNGASGALKLTNGQINLAVNNPAVAPRTFSAPSCLGSGNVSMPKNSIVEGLGTVACPQ